MKVFHYFFDKPLWARYKRQIVGFWILFLLFILLIPFTFWMVSLGALGPLPTFEELENPKTALATEIYSADSVLLGKYYSQNRTNVKFDDLSPNLVNALIATEDVRYYNHPGIDGRGLMRAFVGLMMLDIRGGASTISQQLAKNLFHGVRSENIIQRIKQKLKEQVIAVRLESRYTKDEILAMYLNTVEFNDNAFGVSSAAYTYFKKHPSDLDIEEAAVLVGMLQNPSRFNPRRFPERSTARRNIVMHQMERYGFITEETYETLSDPENCPIVLNFQKSTHTEGMATYFREVLRLELTKWASQPENMRDSVKYDIYKDGLKIYTTINSKMQRYAEAAVQEHMKGLQDEFFKHWKGKWIFASKNDSLYFLAIVKQSDRYHDLEESGIAHDSIMTALKKPIQMKIFTYAGELDTLMSPYDSIYYHRTVLQTGFIVLNPENGNVLAWVGGTNYKYFQYDHVTSRRQIGSTFKPFIYSTAIENGYSPCYQITDAPVTFENYQNWTPTNADGYSYERLTLFQCLAQSKNTCSAYLMKRLGPEVIIQMARRMGITAPIENVPSICLGSPSFSALEMAGAYTVLANKGIYTQPNYINSIQTKDGLNLYRDSPETHDVMSEEQAYVMIELLRYVTNQGTGGRLRYRYKLTADICGKTGTTNDNTDGWYIGYTPQFIGAVWTGGEDNKVRFRSTALGQGANMALPIWGLFAQKLYADKTLGYSQAMRFPAPAGKLPVELDCSKYKAQGNTLPSTTNPSNPNQWDNPNP